MPILITRSPLANQTKASHLSWAIESTDVRALAARAYFTARARKFSNYDGISLLPSRYGLVECDSFDQQQSILIIGFSTPATPRHSRRSSDRRTNRSAGPTKFGFDREDHYFSIQERPPVEAELRGAVPLWGMRAEQFDDARAIQHSMHQSVWGQHTKGKDPYWTPAREILKRTGAPVLEISRVCDLLSDDQIGTYRQDLLAGIATLSAATLYFCLHYNIGAILACLNKNTSTLLGQCHVPLRSEGGELCFPLKRDGGPSDPHEICWPKTIRPSICSVGQALRLARSESELEKIRTLGQGQRPIVRKKTIFVDL